MIVGLPDVKLEYGDVKWVGALLEFTAGKASRRASRSASVSLSARLINT